MSIVDFDMQYSDVEFSVQLWFCLSLLSGVSYVTYITVFDTWTCSIADYIHMPSPARKQNVAAGSWYTALLWSKLLLSRPCWQRDKTNIDMHFKAHSVQWQIHARNAGHCNEQCKIASKLIQSSENVAVFISYCVYQDSQIVWNMHLSAVWRHGSLIGRCQLNIYSRVHRSLVALIWQIRTSFRRGICCANWAKDGILLQQCGSL